MSIIRNKWTVMLIFVLLFAALAAFSIANADTDPAYNPAYNISFTEEEVDADNSIYKLVLTVQGPVETQSISAYLAYDPDVYAPIDYDCYDDDEAIDKVENISFAFNIIGKINGERVELNNQTTSGTTAAGMKGVNILLYTSDGVDLTTPATVAEIYFQVDKEKAYSSAISLLKSDADFNAISNGATNTETASISGFDENSDEILAYYNKHSESERNYTHKMSEPAISLLSTVSAPLDSIELTLSMDGEDMTADSNGEYAVTVDGENLTIDITTALKDKLGDAFDLFGNDGSLEWSRIDADNNSVLKWEDDGTAVVTIYGNAADNSSVTISAEAMDAQGDSLGKEAAVTINISRAAAELTGMEISGLKDSYVAPGIDENARVEEVSFGAVDQFGDEADIDPDKIVVSVTAPDDDNNLFTGDDQEGESYTGDITIPVNAKAGTYTVRVVYDGEEVFTTTFAVTRDTAPAKVVVTDKAAADANDASEGPWTMTKPSGSATTTLNLYAHVYDKYGEDIKNPDGTCSWAIPDGLSREGQERAVVLTANSTTPTFEKGKGTFTFTPGGYGNAASAVSYDFFISVKDKAEVALSFDDLTIDYPEIFDNSCASYNGSISWDTTLYTGLDADDIEYIWCDAEGNALADQTTGPKDAGSYSLKVSIREDHPEYTGSATKSFEIGQYPLYHVTIADVAAQDYTGSAITPKPAVSYEGLTLVEGVDFTYDYKDNINATNSASVLIKAVEGRNYSDTGSKSFTINQIEYTGNFEGSMEVLSGTYQPTNKAYSFSYTLPAGFVNASCGDLTTVGTIFVPNTVIASIAEGKLVISFTVAANSATADATANITVPVNSTNYTETDFKLVVNVVDKGEATVTIGDAPDSVTYGDEPFTLSASATDKEDNALTEGSIKWDSSNRGVLDVDADGKVTVIAANADGEKVTITATYEDDNFYGEEEWTVSVGKKAITISGITAADKTYDGTTAATLVFDNVSFGGIVAGDALSVSADGAFVDANAGKGKTVNISNLALGGNSVGNYELSAESQTTATADINKKAVTISGITVKDKVYDGTTDATLDCYNIQVSGTVNNDYLDVTADGAFEDANVGEDKTVNISNLALGGPFADNYELAATGQQTTTTATIKKADYDDTLSDSINVLSKTYQPTDKAYSFSYTLPADLVSPEIIDDIQIIGNIVVDDSEKASIAEGKLTVGFTADADNATTTGEAGNILVPIDSTNYNTVFFDLTIIIVDKYEATVTIEDAPNSVTYGDEPFTLSASATDKEDNALTEGSIKWESSNPDVLAVDENGKVTVKAANADGENVTITATYEDDNFYGEKEWTVSVGKKAITISGITAADKTYDGNTNATLVFDNVSFGGIVAGDALSVTADGAFADKDAATGKTVILTVTLTGNTAINYELSDNSQTTTTANINKKAVTVSGITADNKVYDGSTDATLNYDNVSFGGIVAGDDLSVTADGEFADDNVGTDIEVQLSNITLGGADAANYELAATGQQTTASADINPANISGSVTIAADSGTVTTGTVLTASATVNGVNGETPAIVYQWFRNGSAIEGATDTTYTVTDDDATASITVQVKAAPSETNYSTSTVLNSNAITVGKIALAGDVVISGDTAVGDTLSSDITDLNSNAVSYQWYRNGVAIAGATDDSYTLVRADQGKTITLIVTALNSSVYTGSVESNELTIPAGAPSAPQNLEASAGNGEITVSWDAPDHDGGAPVTSYLVIITDENGDEVDRAEVGADVRQHSFDGLDNGKEYTITVTAKNGVDDPNGEASASVTATPVEEQVERYRVTLYISGNGTASASRLWNVPGDEVIITVNPAKGYGLSSIVAVNEKGRVVDLIREANGVYSMIMPASNVTVRIVYVPASLPFTDVKPGDWFYDEVSYVYFNGLMSGLPNDLFAPYGDVTRAMVVQTLHNMEGNPPVYSGNFSDVAAGDWYSQAVKWAAANGITTGYGDGTFAPGKNITRQELAAMLYRYAQYKGMDAITLADYLGQFTDTDEIHAYAVSALNWAVGQGLMQGYNGELNPAGTATRAELAAILARFDRNVLPNLED